MKTINNSYKTDPQKELEQHEALIEELKKESGSLKKAIWDLINYSSMYCVILDTKMIIRLCNLSLANELGFSSGKDMVGLCWLKFIPLEYADRIKVIYNSLAFDDSNRSHKYREVTNDIITKNEKRITIKWFNTRLNHETHMTMSFGLKLIDDVSISESEDSIRSYYHNIIEKDRTMIQSMKDVVLKGVDNLDTCET